MDELAAAASMVMGQASESVPVAIIRGIAFTRDEKASIKKLFA